MNDLITISQLPVIEERLRALKDEWEKKAADAAAMVCTEDTVQDIKKSRAEMRKEFEAAETQRKAVKAAYMEPWARIEAVYKECVTDAYTRADAAYKSKVAEVEDAQKAECEKKCREYFMELCTVHSLPWLRYEDAGMKISLTESKKKVPSGHFDKLSEFVARVACDVEAIEDPEIMAEYKSNGLNLAKAQKTIRDRRGAADAERKAAEERAEAKRREAEAVAKVESAAPAVISPPVVVELPAPVDEKMLTVSFKATATREKLIRLREWMKAEGICYE